MKLRAKWIKDDFQSMLISAGLAAAMVLGGCASGGQIFGEGARWSSLVFSDARPKIRSPYRAGTAQAAPPKKTPPPNRCGHDAPPDRRLLCRGWFSPEIAKGGMK